MVTFLVSAYVLFSIEEVPIVREEEGDSDFKAEMVHALAFTRSQPWLFVGILAFMAFHVGGAIVDIGIPTITLENGWSGLYYGIWGATFPIGAAVGALYAGSNPIPKSSRGAVFYVTVSCAAWLDLLFAFVPWFVLILVITLIQGVMVGVLSVIWNTTIGDSVEQHLRGRVNSIDAIGSFILIPPSMFLGGKMIEELGIEASFIVAVSIMVAATIIGIVVPSFRRFERIATERFPITADQSQSG
jgi:MFS family permease